MFNKQTGEVSLPASQGEATPVADGVRTPDHSGTKQPEAGSGQKGGTPQPALRKRKVQSLPFCQCKPFLSGHFLKREDPLIMTPQHIIPSLFLMARHLNGSAF